MSTVLIVEDETDMALLLRDLLEMQGFRVCVAHDGRDGLAKAMAEAPDVVVTDLMMPRLDGYALIEQLRHNPRTKNTPIIVMSATERVDGVPFVRKPFDFPEILAAIRAVLG